MEYNHTKPVYRLSFDSTIVNFNLEPDEETSVKMSVKTSVKMSVKMSVKIIELIKENREITIPELAKQIGITERSIE